MGRPKKDMLLLTPKSPMEKAKRLVELQAIVYKLKPEIESLKADLLKVTKDLNVLTLKTEQYTITRAKKETISVENFNILEKALKENHIPYGTKIVFADYMGLVFKKLVKDKKILPGLEIKETEYISIRLKGGDDKK